MKKSTKKALILLCTVLCISSIFFFTSDAAAGVLADAAKWVGKKAAQGGIIGGLIYAFIGLNGFCWFCPVYEVLFDAMNSVASATSSSLKTPILSAFAVGLMLWIPLHVSKTLTQWQEVDAMQFLQELMKRFGRALIACVVISFSMPVFYYILNPLLEMTMILCIQIIDLGSEASGTIVRIGEGFLSGLLGTNSICSSAESSIKAARAFSMDMQPFSDSIKQSMTCMLTKVSGSLIMGMVIGSALIWDGLTDIIGLETNLVFMSSGVIILGTYLLIYISFPFKMIDSMVRLTFVAALMPIWVALWVFPATVEYTKNAWNMFIGSCILFLTLAIIMLLIFHILPHMMPKNLFNNLITSFLLGLDIEALSLIPATGRSTITMAALGFLCWKLLGTADALANSFSKQQSLGMGSAMDQHTTKLISTVGGATGAMAAGAVMGGEMLTNKFADGQRAKRGKAPSDAKNTELNTEAKKNALKNIQQATLDVTNATTPEQRKKAERQLEAHVSELYKINKNLGESATAGLLKVKEDMEKAGNKDAAEYLKNKFSL